MVWLLLIVCVALLAVMLIWWGGFQALAGSINSGVSNADAILGPTGLSLRAVSELSSRLMSALVSSDPTFSTVFGGAGLPFAPVCAPVCLNLGSFAPVLRARDSCVCGADVIDAARSQSLRGATSAAVGLAGAAAMWLASCMLLVILASHAVTAGFDRRSAAWLKEQKSARAMMGFSANPKDCLPVSSDVYSADNEAVMPAAVGGRHASFMRDQRSSVL